MNLEELKNITIRNEKKLYDVSFLFYDVGFPKCKMENPRDDETFKELLSLIQDIELLKVYRYIEKNEVKMNPIDLHFLYTALHEGYYKLRGLDGANIQKAKIICEKDVALLECDFFNLELAYIPCLNRLINIYENNGEFDNAVELCIFGAQRFYNSKMLNGFPGKIKSIKSRKKRYEELRKNRAENN